MKSFSGVYEWRINYLRDGLGYIYAFNGNTLDLSNVLRERFLDLEILEIKVWK